MLKSVVRNKRAIVTVDLGTFTLKTKLEKIARAESRTLSNVIQLAAKEVAARGCTQNGTTSARKIGNA